MAPIEYTTNNESQKGNSASEAGTTPAAVETTRRVPEDLGYNMKRWLGSAPKTEFWTPLGAQSGSDASVDTAAQGMADLNIRRK
ncbi:hypothetical protein Dda_7157 [Drechslerella dactyloides]|uniref:Uncharacterized protein n=1 Tax=Drechslerella dactyloides TaxID=74499 RepID=A0AAD6ITI6_DREDA|nr:hypothetical protein Dda_7157 [Drechslerella dactyloides]